MGYTWPVPTEEELKIANRQIYTVENRIAAYHRNRLQLETRYQMAISRINRFKSGGRLLDVGCSLGFFVSASIKAGYLAEGVEMNPDSARYAAHEGGIKVFCGTLSEANYADHTFDVVTLYDVLEHVNQPFVLLAELARILKPDGLLVLQMPNIRSFMAAVARDDWPWLCPPDHVHHFSPKSLRLLLLRAGFRVTDQLTWEPALDFATTLLSIGAKYSRIPVAIERRTRITERIIRILQGLWWKFDFGGLVETFATPRSVKDPTP